MHRRTDFWQIFQCSLTRNLANATAPLPTGECTVIVQEGCETDNKVTIAKIDAPTCMGVTPICSANFAVVSQMPCDPDSGNNECGDCIEGFQYDPDLRECIGVCSCLLGTGCVPVLPFDNSTHALLHRWLVVLRLVGRARDICVSWPRPMNQPTRIPVELFCTNTKWVNNQTKYKFKADCSLAIKHGVSFETGALLHTWSN